MKTVMLVSPYFMTAKTFISDTLLDILTADSDIKIHLVVPNEFSLNKKHSDLKGKIFRHSLISWKHRKSFFSRIYFFLGFVIHLCLVYRFNSISGFSGFRNRVKQSYRQKIMELTEGIPSFRIFGFPFAENLFVYRAIKNFYYCYCIKSESIDNLITNIRPSLVVVMHCQNHLGLLYAQAAIKNNIRTLGIIGSWDQPTTKGPIFEKLDEILVPNACVKAELVTWHGASDERIHIVGWPQLDSYFDERLKKGNKNIRTALGLKCNEDYLVFGAYGHRLGNNEEKLIINIANFLEESAQLKNCFIFIRPHPLDVKRDARYSGLVGRPNIIVETELIRKQIALPQLLGNSIGVIAVGGTIILDGLAGGTPALGVAFERDADDYYECSARRYEMEHWQTVITRKCTAIAQDFMEVEREILNWRIRESQSKVQSRDLREIFGYLDGKSTMRLGDLILTAACKSR